MGEAAVGTLPYISGAHGAVGNYHLLGVAGSTAADNRVPAAAGCPAVDIDGDNRPVGVSCDGCEQGLTAKVSFIARSAEFTPPVIYSQEERAKLVFLIEARPEHPEKFRVGQPVTVTLPQESRK